MEIAEIVFNTIVGIAGVVTFGIATGWLLVLAVMLIAGATKD